MSAPRLGHLDPDAQRLGVVALEPEPFSDPVWFAASGFFQGTV
jgi:hypothetical protein